MLKGYELELLDKAIKKYNGVWDGSGDCLVTSGKLNVYFAVGEKFDFVTKGSYIEGYWDYLCSKDQYLQRAKELGYPKGEGSPNNNPLQDLEVSKMNIESQKGIALEVLQKLHAYIDSGAIIAGGAPRNWDNGKLANDIDIYIRCYADNIKNPLGLVLGEENLDFLDKDDLNYNLGVHYSIKRISTFIYKGVEFQVMAVEPKIYAGELTFPELVLGGFDTGINMIYAHTDWHTGSLNLYKTWEYTNDLTNNTITLYSGNMSGSQLKHCIKTHLPKLQGYFPEYKVVFK